MAHGDDKRTYVKDNHGTLYAHSKHVTYNGSQSPEEHELQRRLDELQLILTQYAAALPDVRRMQEVTEELGNQLQGQRQPSRTIVRSLLDSLTAGAGGVTAVLTAVNGLAGFVTRFL
ncbi:hypothetical protein ACFOZ0_10545 [Streptomyces yaanensis]|uniref:Uncharacterized protein n=1 Tax=Streptomyces yaanensis TaxID=1142239 RepID=A0ABV7SBX9_9ACTN|nr:hypothetical protein [Streptomyces sp. CGMCC 4.7035]WNB96784.1 hypothetical protein Q2K21_01130 [Streptomyces sp. CGMCC 4.7035]